MSLVFNHVTNDISDNAGGVPLLGGFATNNAYVDADKNKVDFIDITQTVDLDVLESRVNALDAAVILMGTFAPSGGVFPGGGTAQAGESWIATDSGTIDTMAIVADNRVIAITDNASTVDDADWHKSDYTDIVQSVAGKTGVVTLVTGDITGVATDSFLGRTTAATGVAEVLSVAAAQTLMNVEDGSTADQSDAEIETAYNNQVTIVSQVEAEAGVATTVRRWTAQRVGQAIAALASGVEGINVETLVGPKTLISSDDTVQALDPDAVARNVDLPVETDTLRFKIFNTGTATADIINVRNDAAGAIVTLGPRQSVELISDGIGWYGVQAVAGSGATSTSLGENAIASGTNSVSIGPGTQATAADTISTGFNAIADNALSTAWGTEAQTTRVSEFTMNIDGAATEDFIRGSIGLTATTASLTPTELLCGGTAAERITIQPSSVLVYTALVTGRDETSGDCCAYAFRGSIKRDAANATAQVGVEVKDILGEDDTAFDVDIVADDTNEALQINVTAATTNSTQWVAEVQYAETRF